MPKPSKCTSINPALQPKSLFTSHEIPIAWHGHPEPLKEKREKKTGETYLSDFFLIYIALCGDKSDDML